MRIGLVGGTGKEGRGLSLRWARAGHEILIGSRDAEKARARAAELAADGLSISGGDNTWAANACEVAVLAVPYAAHRDTLTAIKAQLANKVLIDITVPLVPPKIRQVTLPAGKAAALEAQETREWLESLDYVLDQGDKARVVRLLEALRTRARAAGGTEPARATRRR